MIGVSQNYVSLVTLVARSQHRTVPSRMPS